MIRFVQRHRTLAALVQGTPLRSWISRRVWSELESDPAFVEGVVKGLADLKVGRRVPWSDMAGAGEDDGSTQPEMVP